MSEVFDLSKIQKFIQSRHPRAIAIVDTNIVMREPDFSKWETGVGDMLFVLSVTNMLELQHIKQNREKESHSKENARKAINSLCNLFGKGAICDGIELEKTGCFVSVPVADHKRLKERLASPKYRETAKAFKTSDTKLMILEEELSQLVPNVPVVLLTADRSLYGILEMSDYPSCLFESFPLVNFKSAVSKRLSQQLEPLDWDKTLEEIQETTAEQTAEVEITLAEKAILADAAHEGTSIDKTIKRALVKGSGVIHEGAEIIPFLWSLPFNMYDLDSIIEIEEAVKNDQTEPVSIDFLGRETQIPEVMVKNLGNKLRRCTDPMAWLDYMPTFQELRSVMHLMLLDDVLSEVLKEQADTLKKEIDEVGLMGSVRFHEYIKDEIGIEECQSAWDSCWSIGETRNFTILKGEPPLRQRPPDGLFS